MSFRFLMSRRALIPVALVVAVVVLAISPRAMLAPTLSFNQAQESKRPKCPKNVVRAVPTHASNSEKSGRQAKVAPQEPCPHAPYALQVRIALTPRVPDRALRELTKPDYLKLFSGSSPRAGLAPPA